jgi:phenylacetate-CoA ligase
MNVKRLIRIISRLNDLQYLKYALRHFKNNLLTYQELSYLKKYHQGNERDFTSARDRKLIDILKYAYENTPYYKRIFNQLEIKISNVHEDWNRIPLLDKNIIRNEKSDILAISPLKDYVSFGSTGGSTGQPLGFYQLGGYDAEHQKFLYELMGYRPGDKILAMDGTLIPDELLNKNIYWIDKSDSDIPYGSVALSSQYLSSKNVHFYINFIKKFKPDIIRGYPSFIDSIAIYILKNNIKLDLNLKGVELTSESFYDYQVENIKSAFGTKVYNQYGHAETSVFGYSVDDTLMTYCSPFYGYTEVLREDTNHVNPGEIGEIVVTGFNNYALPFIRYRTGDLALYEGEENGIVKLKRVFGRTQDYIYTNDMEKILLTAIVFGRHYKAFDNIEKWQIEQNVPGEIIFKVIKSESFGNEDIIELQQNFYNIAKIKTTFEFVDSLPLTARGKSKFLIQNVLSNKE